MAEKQGKIVLGHPLTVNTPHDVELRFTKSSHGEFSKTPAVRIAVADSREATP